MEAHGGYAFCGLAALFMLKKQHLCDVQSLLVSYNKEKQTHVFNLCI